MQLMAFLPFLFKHTGHLTSLLWYLQLYAAFVSRMFLSGADIALSPGTTALLQLLIN